MSARFKGRQIDPLRVDVQPLHTDHRQPDRYRIFVTVTYEITGTEAEALEAGNEIRRAIAGKTGAAA